MTHEFEILVTREMVQKAWRAWFWKNRSWWKLIFGMALVGCGVALDVSDGKMNRMSVITLTIVATALGLYAGVYFLGRKRAAEKLHLIENGKARYQFCQENIQASSSLGSSTLPWTTVKEVRRYGDLVLLGFQGTAYSTLPAAQIPPEALAFLLEKGRACGAKITGF